MNKFFDRHLRNANIPPELGMDSESGIALYIACTVEVGPPMRVVPVSIAAAAEDPVGTVIVLP